MILVYILIFILGLIIGSFLNVVILRLKAGEEFVKGRSKCPKCGQILKWYENIPLLSFIFLLGKCSECKKRISWQYPIVELSAGLLFWGVFMKVFNGFSAQGGFALGGNGLLSCYLVISLSFYWAAVSFLIIIFVYDLKYYLIPDKVSLPAIGVVLIFQALILLIKNNFDFSLFLIPYSLFLLAAVLLGGFFLVQFLISKGKWIGGGDIRLGFLMGLILGWPMGLVALMLAYILGILVALPLLILGKKKMKSEVPFGTFLVGATIIALFWGEIILNWYLNIAF